MVKVTHVKSARKAKPECGVAVGDSYYHWSVMTGGRGSKRCSKTYPKPSVLTQSAYYQAVYGLQEDIAAATGLLATIEELDAARTEWAEQARAIGEEQTEKHDNMPQGLQDGDVGQLLLDRSYACEAWAEEIEGVDLPDAEDLDDEYDEYADALQDAIDETVSEIAALSPE